MSSSEARDTSARPVLEVENLRVEYGRRGFPHRSNAVVTAVDGVSFTILPGQTLGLVGESGCGKSTLVRAILGLTPTSAGSVRVNGRLLHPIARKRSREDRSAIQLVFQDPYSSLDPRMTVRQIIAEPLMIRRVDPENRVDDIASRVGLTPGLLDRRPISLSGGQRQRVGIARALLLEPEVLILDEPVSALDVSVQAQVLNLLADLQSQLGVAYLFIAHDLSVVRHLADDVAVMNRGRIVESGANAQVFETPQHAYTKTLLAAAPVPDPRARRRAQPDGRDASIRHDKHPSDLRI